MPGRSRHGREPEPVDEILDCLAYVQAAFTRDADGATAAWDVLRLRLAGRSDAMVAPLQLARLIVDEAEQRGCDVAAVLAGVRHRALAGATIGTLDVAPGPEASTQAPIDPR
jgi:hypothetical protein